MAAAALLLEGEGSTFAAKFCLYTPSGKGKWPFAPMGCPFRFGFLEGGLGITQSKAAVIAFKQTLNPPLSFSEMGCWLGQTGR